MAVWRRAMERLRAVRHIEWVLLAIGAALLMLMNTSRESVRESSALERRMEAVLECIQGAGRVRVLVNAPETTEVFFAEESRSDVVGVLVVAEGADDLKVSMALQQAVQTLLGIEAAQIEILDMKEDEP